MSKRKLKTLNLNTKYLIINEIEEGTKKSIVASRFGIPRSTLSTIVKNRVKIQEAVEKGVNLNSYRLNPVRHAKLDSALRKWIKLKRDKNKQITGPMIKEKALFFAKSEGIEDFSASEGWLQKFKNRCGIVLKTECEESADVSDESVESRKRIVSQSTSRHSEENEDSNTDETGCLHNQNLASKNEKNHNRQHSEEEVECFVNDSMSGVDDIDDDECPTPPSIDEVRSAFNTIRCFLDTSEGTSRHIYKSFDMVEDYFENISFSQHLLDFSMSMNVKRCAK